MMNWKKEGWEVGQEVFLVVKGMFTRDIKYQTGKVTHVGTKLLKVDVEPKMQLTFKDNNQTSGHIASFGYIYEVFKSKEDFYEESEKRERKKYLVGRISRNIQVLSDEKLELINTWIKEATNQWQKN